MTIAENDLEMLTRELRFPNRIMRDDAAIVFDLDLQLIVRQHSFPELKDFRETIGL